MNCFVVVTGRGGGPVPPDVLDRLAEPSPRALARPPEAAHLWRTEDGRVAAAAWESGGAALGVGSRWHTDEHGLATFSGLLWSRGRGWDTGPTWAAQLGGVLRRGRWSASDAERFDGIWTLASLDAHGHGVVAGDPLGFGALYWAETPTCFVVSNRAAVAAWLATPPGRTPAVDLDAAGDLAFVSYPLGDRTGFAAVRAVPQGAFVRLDRAGAAVDQPTATPWLVDGLLPRLDLEEMLPVIAGDIRASLRVATALTPAGARFELTGGKDSRLVLAHLLAEGLEDRCTFFTWGAPDLPDVVVAGDLIDRFDLRRVGDPPRHPLTQQPVPRGTMPMSARAGPPLPTPSPEAEPAARLAWHLHATSGASSSWDQRPLPGQISPAVAITGFGGETMRTIHGRTAPLTTRDDVVRYVRLGGFGADPARILTPEARRHHQDRLIAAIDAVWPADGSPQDAIDGFYLSQRLRRWFSALHEHDGRNRTFPLYTMSGVRTAYAIGHRRRHDAVLIFRLMTAAHPELAKLPFAGAGSGWPAGAVAGLPDAAAYPTAAGPTVDRAMRAFLEGEPASAPAARRGWFRRRPGAAPTPSALPRLVRPGRRPETAVEAAQLERADATVALLLAHADVGPGHPLEGVVDLDALRATAARFRDLDYLSRRAVHDAATAVRWASEGPVAP